MKRILPLFCLALTVAPLAAPSQGHAESLGADVALASVVRLAFADSDDRKRPHGGQGQKNRNSDNGGGNRSDWNNRSNDDDDRSRREDRSADGMATAYRMASRYGRVIDVWPEGGSKFGASVSSTRGKIELRIDVATGDVREK